jgi:Xaa-Pro aminopeptidase
VFKEESLLINDTNEIIVKENMVFHVRVTLNEVDPSPSRAIIAIGDTVLIGPEGPIVLTGKISRKYSEISYCMSVLSILLTH